jgi:putative transcriptional regulator
VLTASLWRCLVVFSLAAALWPARLDAALPKSGLSPQAPTLTGQLLIASPRIGDPRFRHTVILMVRHDRTGALGVVINRPVAERSLAVLLDEPGDKDLAEAGAVRIFAGGPVQPEIGFIVHSADYERQETVRVSSELAVTGSLDVLRDMARGKGPAKVLVALGYAGWGSGQLEAELARGDWLVIPADPELVFDMLRERVWDEALTRGSRQ